jgi:hypothetical protein
MKIIKIIIIISRTLAKCSDALDYLDGVIKDRENKHIIDEKIVVIKGGENEKGVN